MKTNAMDMPLHGPLSHMFDHFQAGGRAIVARHDEGVRVAFAAFVVY